MYEQKRVTERADIAWNACSIELCHAARLHVRVYLIRNYFERCSSFKGSKEVSRILQDLGKLYALYQLTHSQYLFSKVSPPQTRS